MNRKEKIAQLKKNINNQFFPEALKPKLLAQIEALQKEIDAENDKSKSKNINNFKIKVEELVSKKQGDFLTHEEYKKIKELIESNDNDLIFKENIDKELHEYLLDIFSEGEDFSEKNAKKIQKELDEMGYSVDVINLSTGPRLLDPEGVNSWEIYNLTKKSNEQHSKQKKPITSKIIKSKLKKYYAHRDIKTVTVIENGKKVVYKGEDVFNGAQFLAKGGKLENKATYYPVRAIVEVELTDGSKVKPANGYHIKNGAKPIMEKGGELDYSGKSAKQVWENWSKKQREHFLADHYDVIEPKDLASKDLDFENLDFLTQSQIELHISQGKYEKGGKIKNLQKGQIFTGPRNSKYEKNVQLYHPNISYILKPTSENKFEIIGVFNTPLEALKERDKNSEWTNYKIHYTNDLSNYEQWEKEIKKYADGGKTETNEDFDFIQFLDDMQPKVAEVLKEKGVEIDKFYKVTINNLKLVPTILYSSLEDNANKVVIGYYDKNNVTFGEIGSIEFELPEKEFHIRFPALKINEVEMYAKGGWTTDHNYVNKAEDYEVRYAKGKNRKGYAEKGMKTTKFDYKNNYSPLNITNSNNVKDFFKYLVNVENVSFHPDDDFDDYINFKTKKKTFTKKQAENLNKYMEDCFIVMDLPKNKDKEIYDIAIEVMNENKALGGDVELPAGSFEQYMIYREKGGKIPVGRLAKGKTLEDIASMHNVLLSEIEKQMELGEKVEMEHTNDVNVARAIAKDHLFENPNYYTLLQKVEKPEAKVKNKTRKNAPGAGSPIFALAKKIRKPGQSWQEAREEAKKQLSK